ncbi:MAG TPA: hypothetical protein VM142_02380 [Acidimicrobiales bacterium]|nr:hypothetical protein [Acidimicrobiales bacterium]
MYRQGQNVSVFRLIAYLRHQGLRWLRAGARQSTVHLGEPVGDLLWCQIRPVLGEVVPGAGFDEQAERYRERYVDPWDAQLFTEVEHFARTASSPAEAVGELVRLCRERRPHADWNALLALDFADDALRIRRWISEVFTAHPPGDDVTHLWFGLGDEGNLLYVIGYPWNPFDEDRIASVVWDPERCADSRVLAAIVAIADADPDEGLGNDASYPLCLGYAGVTLRLALRSLAPTRTTRSAAPDHCRPGPLRCWRGATRMARRTGRGEPDVSAPTTLVVAGRGPTTVQVDDGTVLGRSGD